MAVYSEVADSPTAAMAGGGKGLTMRSTAPGGTSEEHC